MKGDFNRYLAEFVQPNAIVVRKSLESYSAAYQMATRSLSKTHPLLLGLVLNFSVFYIDVLNDREKACELAKQTFDQAIGDLGTLQTDELYNETSTLVILLWNNIKLWSTTTIE